jgi:hypothetical protein
MCSPFHYNLQKIKSIKKEEIKMTFQPERTAASKLCINGSMFHRQECGTLLYYDPLKK